MIGSFVGALIALAARVADKGAGQIAANRCKSEDEQRTNTDRMQALVDGLIRSRAQLIDHIELLERELATERHMSAHWLAEAQRLIREARAQRQADINHAQAQQNSLLAHAQCYQQQPLAQQLGAQNLDAGIWCNCVPSRAQVWGASHSLVNQLNRGE